MYSFEVEVLMVTSDPAKSLVGRFHRFFPYPPDDYQHLLYCPISNVVYYSKQDPCF
jgi:hypothetical protein